MQNNTEKQITDLIRQSAKILILPSSPPDGDSLGSAIALYMALKKLGKEVTVICSDPVPELLQFLPNIKIVGNKTVSSKDFIITVDIKNVRLNEVKTKKEGTELNIILTPTSGSLSEDNITFNKAESDYDLVITVDCAELQQLKNFYENNTELFTALPVINIDHHISNAHFGKINHVDIMASSTTELLLPLLENLAQEENVELIDEDIATLLLTGIITDTGSFQNANTTPKAFAKAARLVSYGARQQEIIQHIYKTKQLSQLKLWGRVLSKIQVDEKHRIVWSVVSQQDFKDTESSEDETGDIIDELMTNAPGAEVVLLIKEKQEGVISVSLRTLSAAANASSIAEHFGGGGHTQAAGFRISDMDLREAEYKIIDYIRKLQKERLGILNNEKEPQQKEKTYSSPMIDVEQLIERAEKGEKLADNVMPAQPVSPQTELPESPAKKSSKKKKDSLKLKTPKPNEDPGVTYRFES